LSRDPEEQRVHDDIISLVEKQYKSEYPYVYVNPNDRKRAAVKRLGIYPDIIVGNEEKKIVFIEEVETEGTVATQDTADQWREFSKGDYQFIIRVPHNLQGKTKEILEDLKIEAEVKWYRALSSGYTIQY
jgi:hypothetical protein